MKESKNKNTKQSKQYVSQKPKPEIRDDLYSRKDREQGFKDGNNLSGNEGKKSKQDN